MFRLAQVAEDKLRRHVMTAGEVELVRMDGETTGQSVRRLWPELAARLEKAINKWGEAAVEDRALRDRDAKYARVQALRAKLLN